MANLDHATLFSLNGHVRVDLSLYPEIRAMYNTSDVEPAKPIDRREIPQKPYLTGEINPNSTSPERFFRKDKLSSKL